MKFFPRFLKIFATFALIIGFSVFVYAQARQYWTTTVIKTGEYSGALGFFSPQSDASAVDPTMILTDNKMIVKWNFSLENGTQWAKKILTSDAAGNAKWADADCGGGYALQGFDENGQKICAELPFGVYSYPPFIRDFLEKRSTVVTSINFNMLMTSVIFSTDENSYTHGAWMRVNADGNVIWFSDKNDPQAEYCWVVEPGGMKGGAVLMDGVSYSGRHWVCRSQFTPRGVVDLASKWWHHIDTCEYADNNCTNEIFGDTFPDVENVRDKKRRWVKTFVGCDVRTNTYAENSQTVINPKTGQFIKKWDACN